MEPLHIYVLRFLPLLADTERVNVESCYEEGDEHLELQLRKLDPTDQRVKNHIREVTYSSAGTGVPSAPPSDEAKGDSKMFFSRLQEPGRIESVGVGKDFWIEVYVGEVVRLRDSTMTLRQRSLRW